MKDSLDHLPADKQAELRRAVPIIREMCDDVVMIVLFGSYARGDYKEAKDLAPDRKSGAPSDYDILLVCRRKVTVGRHDLWHRISERCNGLDPEAPFRIIAHDIAYLKARLSEIHYFFSDVVREGCLLYTTGEYELRVSKTLTPEQQLKVVTEHFEHWFKKAKSFNRQFSHAMNDDDYSAAAFELH